MFDRWSSKPDERSPQGAIKSSSANDDPTCGSRSADTNPADKSTNGSSDIATNKKQQCNEKSIDLTCHSCCSTFANKAELKTHIVKISHPSKNNSFQIRCEFCRHGFQSNNIRNIKQIEYLHALTQDHIYNRFTHMFGVSGNIKHPTTMQLPLRQPSVTYTDNVLPRCEACSLLQVHDFTEHINSKQHEANISIINHFVHFCDMREINPVTCSIQEITFYFDYIFPKTRHNKRLLVSASVHQILTSLSRLHDLVEGSELSGNAELEDHISSLLGYVAKNGVKQIAPFVCFACPFLVASVEVLKDHVYSNLEHKQYVEKHHLNKLQCDACDQMFARCDYLEYHTYSKEHLQNEAKLLDGTESFIPLPTSHQSPSFCYICGKEHNCQLSETHKNLESDVHQSNQQHADKYLKYCKTNSLNPVTCEEENVTAYLFQFYSSVEMSENIKQSALQVLSKINHALHTMGEEKKAWLIARSFDIDDSIAKEVCQA